METALIVSASEKGNEFFIQTLRSISCDVTVTVKTCGEARRTISDRDFDLFIINGPLQDESGEEFAIDMARHGTSQVIFVVKGEHFDAISSVVEDYGVITVPKPINKGIFWTSLKFARAANSRVRKMKVENQKLSQRIEDIKIIDRAKHLLVARLKMSEQQAHKYIEKQAMDMRSSKRAIAETILRTYQS